MKLNLFDLLCQHLLEIIIINPFGAIIHITRTLRGQGHSGLLPVLKESDCGHHKRYKQKQPPPAAEADRNRYYKQEDGNY